MDKIYLASDSKARRKVLEIFGLKFKVLPSKISEKSYSKNITYAALVKNNAYKKARAAAEKIKEGIIIGADTIVVEGGNIFGKPKDMDDARKMLKQISSKPQWVYTGLAVIKKRKGKGRGKGEEKILVGYEKTKVIMDKLTDKEISAYFKQVSPLDKAGSFDIQGKGAFFIRRIEGCFYNVVGLPLRKLYRMFQELGIKSLLMLLCICVLAVLGNGCSSEYNIVTGKEEAYFYNTDKEMAMGQAIARKVEKEYKLVNDPLIQNRVELIGNKIAAVCDRKDIVYYFKALEEDEVNAVSLPGGFVYVNKGLIDKVSNDDELAGVLAHEVGHIVARHSIKKLQAMMSYSLLRILSVQFPQTAETGNAADMAFTEIMLGYARDDELLADQLAARYAKLAGYDPQGMISFLEKLQDINRRRPLEPRIYLKTHPYVPDRIRVVKQEIGQKMGFDDYINIEEKKSD